MINALLAFLLMQPQAVPPVAAPADPASPGVSEFAELPGFLGVVPANVTPADVLTLGLPGEAGAIIREVMGESPAAKSGLRKGDVITGFGESTVQSVAQFRRLVRETPPGRAVALTIIRNGQPAVVSVTLAEPAFNLGLARGSERAFVGRTPEDREIRLVVAGEGRQAAKEQDRASGKTAEDPSAPRSGPALQVKSGAGIGVTGGDDAAVWVDGNRPAGEYLMRMDELGRPRLGVTVVPMSEQLARFFGLQGRSGVLVTTVVEGSPAAKAGFEAGDVILAMDGAPVLEASGLRMLLGTVETGTIDVKILRDKKEIELKPLLEKEPDEIIIHRYNESPLRGADRKIVIRIDDSQGSCI